MTHRLSRSAAIGFAVICFAEAASAESVAGRWKFLTDALPSNGCFISGEMVMRATAKTNEFVCAFVSQEDCVTFAGVKTFQRVQQSCTARVSGKSVTISSKVEKIVDAGPANLRDRMMQLETYSPDDFSVELNTHGELVGLFHSRQQSGVRFWRDADLVS